MTSHRFGIVPLIVLCLGSVVRAQSPSPVTIFGPETFARGLAMPVTEVRQVSKGWDEPPFYLHLTNGQPDGKGRCSSAHIRLDGTTVFGPSDFSQRVASLDAEVNVFDTSTLEVTLESAPGCNVTIWIEGMPPTRTVGPEGGILDFPGDIVLTIPPGAVVEETWIALQPLSCTEADAIIAAQDTGGFHSHARRCIGGFRAAPEHLQFAVPIRASFPVLPIDTGEVPVPLRLDLAGGSYHVTSGELIYRGTERVVEMDVSEFSAPAAGAQGTECDPTNIECLGCRACSTWDATKCNTDPLQPPCCTLPQAQRGCTENGYPTNNCLCCRELEAHVESNSNETQTKECSLVSSGGTVTTFPYCTTPDGSPTVEEDRWQGMAEDCEKNLDFVIEVTGPLTFPACEVGVFTAALKGYLKTDPAHTTPKIVYSDPSYFTWSSNDDRYATLLNSGAGWLFGVAPGDLEICASDAASAHEAHKSVQVTPPPFVSVVADQTVVPWLGSVSLHAEVRSAPDGPVLGCVNPSVEWGAVPSDSMAFWWTAGQDAYATATGCGPVSISATVLGTRGSTGLLVDPCGASFEGDFVLTGGDLACFFYFPDRPEMNYCCEVGNTGNLHVLATIQAPDPVVGTRSGIVAISGDMYWFCVSGPCPPLPADPVPFCSPSGACLFDVTFDGSSAVYKQGDTTITLTIVGDRLVGEFHRSWSWSEHGAFGQWWANGSFNIPMTGGGNP